MDKTALKQKVFETVKARRDDIEAIARAILAEPELGAKEVKPSAKSRDKTALKQKVYEAVKARRGDIEAIAKAILDEPELGYKEVKTSAKVRAAFDALGLQYTTGWGMTGLKARLKGGKPGRTVAILGELDAVICKNSPFAAETGAAHCCGHNVQIANMLAVAWALKDSGVMAELSGDVVFFAVPAEEYVELGYRAELVKQGKINYLGGKEQIIKEGGFDDIDIAMQMHVDITDNPNGHYGSGASCNGFIGKIVEYLGKAAHAAGAPDKGINALNAAMIGMMGVNAIRDRFKESDFVRFHPILTNAGDLVNVVPDHVTMESYVRAATLEGLKQYNGDINRALKAGADAVGASCVIHDMPGYLPLRPDLTLRGLLEENAREFFPAEDVQAGPHNTASTDMGDVSHLLPIVHSWVGCAKGALHGANYELSDTKTAFEKSPTILAWTVLDLLADDGAKAEEICRNFKPVLTKESYCAFMDSIGQ